jgi:hypothetical protein
LPCRLRLLDVPPGGLSLFCSSHFIASLIALLRLFSFERKQEAKGFIGINIGINRQDAKAARKKPDDE